MNTSVGPTSAHSTRQYANVSVLRETQRKAEAKDTTSPYIASRTALCSFRIAVALLMVGYDAIIDLSGVRQVAPMRDVEGRCARMPFSMYDYEKEKWFELYKTAMLELHRTAVRGRISDARTVIAARLDKLKEQRDAEEHRAIEYAIAGLNALEREEEELAAEDSHTRSGASWLSEKSGIGHKVQARRQFP
jgi:hypothetical protein